MIFKKDSEDEIEESIGCKIDWKEDKDLTVKKSKKVQKNKKTGEIRKVIFTKPAKSFFNAFETHKQPES